MEPGVLDASTTVISRLFEISRMSASAKVELAAAEVELAQLKRLEYPGAVSRGQLQSAELKVKQLSGQVALNQIELEAVSDALQRNVELAKAAKDHAKLGLDVIETQYKTGIVKVEKLDSARYELQKAEKQLEAALANVRQLEKAMRIIDGPQTKTEADEEGANTDVAD
jgi:multidrug resistance efflux pump